jgi:hypothetical protein
MRNLFRRASFLYWQHPILWLPIAIVDPIIFFLNLLDDRLTRAIVLSVVTEHSVLSNTPEAISPISSQASRTLEWLLLTKPIDWATHLIAICLYACAMMTIFNLITALRSTQKLSLSKILLPLQRSFPGLVFFSLKLLIAIGIGAILLITVFVFFVRNAARYTSTQNLGLLFSVLAFSVLGYLTAPAAVKLLRPQDFGTITPETTRHARIFAALAVASSNILYFFATQIRPTFISFSTPRTGALIYNVVTSVVSATPYTLLFIALSLIATGDEPDSELLGAEPELI